MMRWIAVRCALSVLGSVAASALWLVTQGTASVAELLRVLGVFLLVSLGFTVIPGLQGRARRSDGYRGDVEDRALAQLGYGACWVDAAGTIKWLNQAAESGLGYRLAELKGKEFHQTLHDCRGSSADCTLAAALATGNNGRWEDAVLRRHDGSPLAIGYTAAPLFKAGRIDGVVLAFHDATEQQRALSTWRDKAALYREIVLASSDPVVVTDLYGYVILGNAGAAAMLCYPSESVLLDVNALDFVAPDDRARAIHDKERVIAGEEVAKAEYRWARGDGSVCPVEVTMKLIRDETGAPRGLVQLARDLGELKQVKATIQAGEARLAMQDAIAKVLAETSRFDRALPSLLQALCRWSGWEVGAFWKPDPDENALRCRELWLAQGTLVPRFENLSRDEPLISRGDPLFQAWQGKEPIWLPDVGEVLYSARLMAAKQDGLGSALCVPVPGSNRLCGVIELFSTSARPQDPELMRAVVAVAAQIGQYVERKEAEAALEHQALHDSLTGLANRTLFHDRLQQAILRAERYAWPVSLLLMDLDGFKEINDTLGHHAGDELLCQLADRLQHLFRHSDTIARMGGDEFALVLPGTGETGAIEAADKILSELRAPFHVEGRAVDVGTSIGIARYPDDGDDAHILLRRADVAMYAAKRCGCGYLQGGEEVSPDGARPSQLAR